MYWLFIGVQLWTRYLTRVPSKVWPIFLFALRRLLRLGVCDFGTERVGLGRPCTYWLISNKHKCRCPVLSLFQGWWEKKYIYYFSCARLLNTFDTYRIRFFFVVVVFPWRTIVADGGKGNSVGQPGWIDFIASLTLPCINYRRNKLKKFMNYGKSYYIGLRICELRKSFKKSNKMNKPTAIVISSITIHLYYYNVHYIVKLWFHCTILIKFTKKKKNYLNQWPSIPTNNDVTFGFRGNKNHFV